jgi:hypothetical protein
MIADILAFAVTHTFITGIVVGGCGFGGALGVIGWTLGYEAAMRTATGWMRPKSDEVHGDMPNLPPARERRSISTTPGRSS